MVEVYIQWLDFGFFRPQKFQIPISAICDFSEILIEDFSASKIPNANPRDLGFFARDFWGFKIPDLHLRDLKSPGIFRSSVKWKIPVKSHPKATSDNYYSYLDQNPLKYFYLICIEERNS